MHIYTVFARNREQDNKSSYYRVCDESGNGFCHHSGQDDRRRFHQRDFWRSDKNTAPIRSENQKSQVGEPVFLRGFRRYHARQVAKELSQFEEIGSQLGNQGRDSCYRHWKPPMIWTRKCELFPWLLLSIVSWRVLWIWLSFFQAEAWHQSFERRVPTRGRCCGEVERAGSADASHAPRRRRGGFRRSHQLRGERQQHGKLALTEMNFGLFLRVYKNI